jgi:SAM-dependent methyltransferase
LNVFDWGKIQRGPDGDILLLWRHQRLFDEGILRRGVRMLDVGGWGVLATAAIEAGVDCTIFDLFTPDQYYPERVRALPHIVGDICDFDQVAKLDTLFDVVTCFEMLEHCKDQLQAVRNMTYFLRPGGVLAGTVPLPGRGAHGAGGEGIRLIGEPELRRLLQGAHLVNVTIEETASIHKDDSPVCLYFTATKRGRKKR